MKEDTKLTNLSNRGDSASINLDSDMNIGRDKNNDFGKFKAFSDCFR